MKTTSATGSRRGLTLVEILVSIIILSSAATLVLQAFARGAHALTLASRLLDVYAFSRTKMADVELMLRQGAAPSPEGSFRLGPDEVRWSVEVLPSAEGLLMDDVALAVDWTHGPHAYQRRVETLWRRPEAPTP